MALVRFETRIREPYAGGEAFGEVGAFEQLDGTARFAVDPDAPGNDAIVDLRRAARADDGRVHFSADLCIVQPVDASRGNGSVILELPNRGKRRIVPVFNREPVGSPVTRQAHPGDGFLFRHGFTVVSIGWQWDVFPHEDLMALDAPLALDGDAPLGGTTMIEIRPNTRDLTRLLADRVHRPHPAAEGAEADAVLLVRDHEDGEDAQVPAGEFGFGRLADDGTVEPSREHVYLRGGFEPGRIYQVVYRTDRAPVGGVGLLAFRDMATACKRGGEGLPESLRAERVLGFGVSQTGRLLREFLYLGLNLGEDGERAADGLLMHVAGARRGSFNHRFPQPSNQTTPVWGHGFPFADLATTDALTGATAGLLDASEANGTTPFMMSTNTSAEYWRGDAQLAHTATDGTADLPAHPKARSYLFASTQHGAGHPGQARYAAGIDTTSRYRRNVLDYRPLLRAAITNLDAWVRDGAEPPASAHPRADDDSAVERDVVLGRLATLPGLVMPDAGKLPVVRTMDLGGPESAGVARFPAEEGIAWPALVSDVDADGNETRGIRLPDVSVPAGTHIGFNPRDPISGASHLIVPMNGFTHWFAATRAAREEAGDPRPSLEERYGSREDYAARVRGAAEALVEARYAVAEDVDNLVEAALDRYDAAVAEGLANPVG